MLPSQVVAIATRSTTVAVDNPITPTIAWMPGPAVTSRNSSATARKRRVSTAYPSPAVPKMYRRRYPAARAAVACARNRGAVPFSSSAVQGTTQLTMIVDG